MSQQYATGNSALAECQRCGLRLPYRDLVEDGHIPGLLVHPECYEPQHPQEIPVRATDPIALYRPAPEISIPTNEGSPTAGMTIPATPTLKDPPTDTFYLPNTTLAVAASGYLLVLNVAQTFTFGEPIYIRRDDLTWFVSPTASEARTPTFTIHLLEQYSGTAASAGAEVFIGVDGNGTPRP
jgi:hypothetical protein